MIDLLPEKTSDLKMMRGLRNAPRSGAYSHIFSMCLVPESFSKSPLQFPRVNPCGKGLGNVVSVRRAHLTPFAEVSRYILALISRRSMIKHVISVCRCDRMPEHARVSLHTRVF